MVVQVKLPFFLEKNYFKFVRRFLPYKTLNVMGPEHEFSIVDKELNVLPIADKVVKAYSGNLVNFVKLPRFSFGKEFQLHVLELKATIPFSSPEIFEEVMYSAVSHILSFLDEKFDAHLLGTGMHPLLKLDKTRIWLHGQQSICKEFEELFNLNQQGWLNIQSFQLNLPSFRETEAIRLHNELTQISAYLPAIAASSPIFKGRIGLRVDNRLHFYKLRMQEIPSITGDIIPDYASSFQQYKKEVIGGYIRDLVKKGAGKDLLKGWINSRGVGFRFSRSALELKVLDEQECIKSDVAFSCFIRAVLRGILSEKFESLSHSLLVSDFNSIVKDGLNAAVLHPQGKTARQVCQYFLDLAYEHATKSEKKYLWIIKKRIEKGSLSELIRHRVLDKAKNSSLKEAILSVYLPLIDCLSENRPYF